MPCVTGCFAWGAAFPNYLSAPWETNAGFWINFVVLEHERGRENSLVEEMLVRNTGSCTGSSHKPFLLLLQCFASQLRADPAPAGTKQNLQHSLLGIPVSGECGGNSPGFPPAHKPWLELISLKFSDPNISNKLQPGRLLLDCAHLWPGKEYITI